VSRRRTRPSLGVISASALSWVLLTLAPGGCDNDGSISVHFTSGTVSETARCSGSRGEFPLRQSDGLSVIIIVTENTTIVRADFTPGGCSDIVEGKEASVRGSNEAGGVRATEIEIGP
jgi:hypothetical protein